MNAGTTTERVLAALRERLVGEGFRPGDRLDPTMLARQLETSATPVREALHILTGEGLVEARSGGGFHLPFLDETGLKDRYEWSGQLLALAVRAWPPRRKSALPRFEQPAELPGGRPVERQPASLMADRTDRVFTVIGRHSRNCEHMRLISLLNARLHRVRLAEAEVLEGLEAEMEEISTAIESDNRPEILRRLQLYHRKRIRLSSDIFRFI